MKVRCPPKLKMKCRPEERTTPELGLEFVKFVISKNGQEILESTGQPPIAPAVGAGEVPDEPGL